MFEVRPKPKSPQRHEGHEEEKDWKNREIGIKTVCGEIAFVVLESVVVFSGVMTVAEKIGSGVGAAVGSVYEVGSAVSFDFVTKVLSRDGVVAPHSRPGDGWAWFAGLGGLTSTDRGCVRVNSR